MDANEKATQARPDFLNGKRASWVAMLMLLGSISACSSMPDAQVNYRHAQTKVTLKVQRSVMCDASNVPYVATTVTPTVSHSADLSRMYSIQLGKLGGTFTDSDVKVELYEDGRLMSINASSTGQGEAVLKAASTLAPLIAAFAADGGGAPTYPTECAFVKTYGGGKPLIVTYEGTFDPVALSQSQKINPDGASAFYAQGVASAIGEVCTIATASGDSGTSVRYGGSPDDSVITARQPGWSQISVTTKNPGGCTSKPSMWEGRIPVAQLGVEYLMPIPRPATFGKQTFGVAFTESGAMKNVQYVSNTGAAQALGGLGSLLTIAQGETTAQKIANTKAEADLIVQQQRLVQCLADRTTCK